MTIGSTSLQKARFFHSGEPISCIFMFQTLLIYIVYHCRGSHSRWMIFFQCFWWYTLFWSDTISKIIYTYQEISCMDRRLICEPYVLLSEANNRKGNDQTSLVNMSSAIQRKPASSYLKVGIRTENLIFYLLYWAHAYIYTVVMLKPVHLFQIPRTFCCNSPTNIFFKRLPDNKNLRSYDTYYLQHHSWIHTNSGESETRCHHISSKVRKSANKLYMDCDVMY